MIRWIFFGAGLVLGIDFMAIATCIDSGYGRIGRCGVGLVLRGAKCRWHLGLDGAIIVSKLAQPK